MAKLGRARSSRIGGIDGARPGDRDLSDAVKERARRMKQQRLILCALLAAQVSGCNALPASGPHHYDIADGASSVLLSDPTTVAFNYVLLDINRLVLDNAVDI